MKTLRLGVTVVAIGVSLAGVSRAQSPPAPATSASPTSTAPALRTPAPDLATFYKPYEGDWKCDATFAPNAWGPNKPETKTRGTVKVKKEMGGLWYRGEWEIEKTKMVPAVLAVFVVGYDFAAKAPVMIRYDNTGTLSVSTAPGATADKQVFVGESHVGAKTVKLRDTLTLKGPKDFVHTFEMDTGKGFQLTGTDACTK
jgi:hypothetical protein